MTTLGIEPATLLLVAQCLDQLRQQQRVPHTFSTDSYFNKKGKAVRLIIALILLGIRINLA
jgi:hypothetical protein